MWATGRLNWWLVRDLRWIIWTSGGFIGNPSGNDEIFISELSYLLSGFKLIERVDCFLYWCNLRRRHVNKPLYEYYNTLKMDVRYSSEILMSIQQSEHCSNVGGNPMKFTCHRCISFDGFLVPCLLLGESWKWNSAVITPPVPVMTDNICRNYPHEQTRMSENRCWVSGSRRLSHKPAYRWLTSTTENSSEIPNITSKFVTPRWNQMWAKVLKCL